VKDPVVKAARGYDSSSRRAEASRRRRAVVTAARRRFLEDGYGVTTVASVAADAGVSVESIYKAFRGKAGLVRAVWEDALGGRAEESERAEARSDAAAESARTPREVIRAWAMLSTEVGPLAWPVLSLVRSAALVDPEAAALRDEIEAGRATRMSHNVARLARTGDLRAGLTRAHARDILLAYSTDLYDPLVVRAGWSLEAYREHLERALVATLLD